MKVMQKLDGVALFGGDEREARSLIIRRMEAGEQTVLYTPNPVMMENARRMPRLKAALCRADINLPDGIGVVLAARCLGLAVSQRISGVDVAGDVLSLAARFGWRVFFLGGRAGVAEQAAERMKAKHPQLLICGTRDGYFSRESEAVAQIRAASPDVLFVCLGSPKQELWIDRYRRELRDVRLLMGLGGTLDVLSGCVARAPVWMQRAGLEWLWRMAREPRRMRDLPKMAIFMGRMMGKGIRNLVILHIQDRKKNPF